VSISFEWVPEPGELIDPEDPTKPKRLRELFFKLGKPPEPALGKPLWAGALPPPMWPPEKRIRAAKRKYDLAQRLRDPRKLLAALSYYDKHLRPGEWTILSWPPPHKSRGFVAGWLDALKAARRILGVVTRQAKDERGKVLKGKLRYYLRRDVWPTVQSRLGCVDSQPAVSTEGEELLGFKPLEEIKLEREQFERELDFIDALFSEISEQKFKSLSKGFRLSPHARGARHRARTAVP
jgi:hypothetical protein